MIERRMDGNKFRKILEKNLMESTKHLKTPGGSCNKLADETKLEI